MKKNLKILCDDSYQLENQVQTTKNQRKCPSPLSKMEKNFNLIQHLDYFQMPQTHYYPKDSFQFKSPKYVGIIQKNILQRLEIYNKKYREKKQNQGTSERIKEEAQSIKQLTAKPQINKLSQTLYEKVKNQRKLSPNVLERFQTYECQRVSRNAKYQLLKVYGFQVSKNNLACKRNMNNRSKSPLKQINQSGANRIKQKSPFKKAMCNPQNIGKIVSRKEIFQQVFTDPQLQTQISLTDEEFVFNSLTSNVNKREFSKKLKFFQQKLQHQSNINCVSQFKSNLKEASKSKSFSPINHKQHFTKQQRWKVIS